MSRTHKQTPPGEGHIVCELSPSSSKPSLSTLRAAYPLKLLSPRTHVPHLAAVYVLTYGGGMVSGDRVSLRVECCEDTHLMLLTQGSTKIYKRRHGTRDPTRSSGDETSTITSVTLDAHVDRNALLLQLPEPTTCFRGAEYTQRQTFALCDRTASVVVLDWFTSGRMSRGERWEFTRYESGVDVRVGGRLVFRDVVILARNGHRSNDTKSENSDDSKTELGKQLAPYECYATVVLYGPKVVSAAQCLLDEFGEIEVRKSVRAFELTWSASALNERLSKDDDGMRGVVIKIAGVTTEIVRQFLVDKVMAPLEDVVGENMFYRSL